MAGCNANNPDHIQEAAQITLSAVSSMIKVPMVLEKPLRSTKDTARISAAGGEYESFQVVVSSGNNAAVKGVRWEISALRGETGEIGIVNITVNPVGYVETTISPKVYAGSGPAGGLMEWLTCTITMKWTKTIGPWQRKCIRL